jgi:hypothetical protein
MKLACIAAPICIVAVVVGFNNIRMIRPTKLARIVYLNKSHQFLSIRAL